MSGDTDLTKVKQHFAFGDNRAAYAKTLSESNSIGCDEYAYRQGKPQQSDKTSGARI